MESTQALSRLAGRLGVVVSANDTEDQMIEKIAGSQPIELSDREQSLLLSNREMQIAKLGDKITPAMQNHLSMTFSNVESETLCLSEEGNDAFDHVMLVLDMLPSSGLPTKEKSGPQTTITLANEDADDGEKVSPLVRHAQSLAAKKGGN